MKKILFALMLTVGLTFGQAPNPKPQPAAAMYSINDLNLFPSYTRESYESTLGVQAPAFDPSRPSKDWFDSTQKCDPNTSSKVTYNVASPNLSAPALVPLVLSACDASSVNLKGTIHYDAFRVAPLNVMVVCNLPMCLTQPVSPQLLSTLNEAVALKAELHSDAIVTEVTALNAYFSYKKVDPTSPYGVYKLGTENVGQLLNTRNSKGVGYPGTWTTTPFGHVWTNASDSAVDGGPNAVVLPPVRDLLPNEKLTITLAGLIPQLMVARTDMGGSNSPSTGGGFTDADRQTLQNVLQILNKLFAQ